MGRSIDRIAAAVDVPTNYLRAIEAEQIEVSVPLAVRLCKALSANEGDVFPAAIEVLKRFKKRRLMDALGSDIAGSDEIVRQLRDSGINVAFSSYRVALRFRSGRNLVIGLSASDRGRLWSAFQGDKGFLWVHSGAIAVFINLRELALHRDVFDLTANYESPEASISGDAVCLFFKDGDREPFSIDVEPEWNDPEDLDNVGQVGHLMFMLQALTDDLNEVFALTDADGDTASFTLDSLDCITIPLMLVDDDLVDGDGDREPNIEADDDVPPGSV